MSAKVEAPNKTLNYEAWRVKEQNFRPDDIATLLHWAVLAPSSHNTQPWAFHKTESESLVFLPDFNRALSESDVTHRELYISLGAAVANYKVAARHFGYEPLSEIVKDKKTGATHQKVTLRKGYVPTKEDTTLFNVITKRANYDGEHLAGSLSEEAVNAIKAVFVNRTDIELKLIEGKPKRDEIADLILEGDKQIFSNKRFTGELVRWLRDVSTRRKDGILTSSLGFPSEIRRYAQKLILSAKQHEIDTLAKNDRRKIKEHTTAIGIISSLDNDPSLWMQVGELYQLASLAATNTGIAFGARAVLVETGELHTQLEGIVGTQDKRVQMMFRAGTPAEATLYHTPRLPYQERMAIEFKGELIVPPSDCPSIFHLDSQEELNALEKQLGDIEVIESPYTEHWLPDLFSVRNQGLPFMTGPYLEQLGQFIAENKKVDKGVWVYNPLKRTIEHSLKENDFYEVITANNAGKISKDAQEKLRKMKIGVCGLSGSGSEVVYAIAMSGVSNIRIADSDFISGRNKNRMRGTVGENKTWERAWELWEHNHFLKLQPYYEGITDANRDEFADGLDLIGEQMDSSQKFNIRKTGKEKGAIIVQVTDMPKPIVDIEYPEDADFGGRAAAAGITAEEMENGITSAAQATGYLVVFMGKEKIPAESYQNFSDIVDGESDAFAQIFVGAQGGGASFGQVLLAFAEGKLHELPRSYVVKTRPDFVGEEEKQKASRRDFGEKYEARFGNRFKNLL